METREVLLERFEKAIDLPAYLSSRGYTLAAQPSSAEHLAMNGPRGESLLLRRDLDRRIWTYVDRKHSGERGSVMTFLERREGLDPKAAMERLIACADVRRREVAEAVLYREHLNGKPADLRQAEVNHLAEVERQRSANRVLERLGIPPGEYDAWRFGSVRNEADAVRLVAEPGSGRVWISPYRPTDRKLVLVERPVDAIAYERRHGVQHACYIATGGALDDERRRRLAHLLTEIPGGMGVVLAFGRDRQGEDLASQVRALSPMLRPERQGPELGARWADQMQMEGRHARSIGRAAATGPTLDRRPA
jgi:hypothetical protein